MQVAMSRYGQQGSGVPASQYHSLHVCKPEDRLHKALIVLRILFIYLLTQTARSTLLAKAEAAGGWHSEAASVNTGSFENSMQLGVSILPAQKFSKGLGFFSAPNYVVNSRVQLLVNCIKKLLQLQKNRL